MKRGIWTIAFILLFSSFASGISSDLKSNYELDETIIAEISGEILQGISADNVEFRRGHVLVPFDYDLKKLENKYFLWAITPQNENNYTLIIKNIVTIVNGRIQTIDFMQNFSVSGNLTDYSIKPGAVSTREDFIISVQLNKDNEESISVSFPYEKNVILKPGKNEIKFSIDSVEKDGFIRINIGKYSLPAYLIANKINNSFIEQEFKLRIEPNAIVSKVHVSDNIIYPFRIVNLGNSKIENIELGYNREIFSVNAEKITIEANRIIELNLSFIGAITENLKKLGINEIINITVEKKIFELPVVISFTENKSEANTPYLNGSLLYYCSELKGIVCSAGESCDKEIKASIDGVCCIGKCIVEKKNKSRSWIGYVIAVLLLIVIIYIFRRYRKTKSGEGFSKRVADAEAKMKKLP